MQEATTGNQLMVFWVFSFFNNANLYYLHVPVVTHFGKLTFLIVLIQNLILISLVLEEKQREKETLKGETQS